MSKTIAALNMTLDGICDHTAGVPDEALHQHYTRLIEEGGVILYGRVTYELMKFWKPFVNEPSGEQAMDDFARAIHQIPKLVFSNTIKDTEWETATLATKDLVEEVKELKKNSSKDILIGSRSLIIQLLNLGLIDELQICIHPMLEGNGMRLFDQITNKSLLKLNKTKVFDSGCIVLYYELVVSP